MRNGAMLDKAALFRMLTSVSLTPAQVALRRPETRSGSHLHSARVLRVACRATS
jgi:hypothetical protein